MVKFFLSTLLVSFLVSCRTSKPEVLKQNTTYGDEYKESEKVYKDTVNPQLYYQTDKNVPIIKK